MRLFRATPSGALALALTTAAALDHDGVGRAGVQLLDGPDQLTLRNELVSMTMLKQGGLAHAQIDVLSTTSFAAAPNLLRRFPKNGGGCYWNTVPARTQTNGTKEDCIHSDKFVGHSPLTRTVVDSLLLYYTWNRAPTPPPRRKTDDDDDDDAGGGDGGGDDPCSLAGTYSARHADLRLLRRLYWC